MGVLKGDFLGFTYNGVHSSALGITRTSDGTRYKNSILPSAKDQTIQVPGGDGTYYFGSFYSQKTLEINFAFDGLTEVQWRYITELWGDRKIHDLIFDELPYKVYKAKIANAPSINSICFDEDIGRIYKGEGAIQFVCYDPFAHSRYKYREQYNTKNIPEWEYSIADDDNQIELYESDLSTFYNNLDEWIAASRIRNQGSNDKYNKTTKSIPLYNAGDIDTDFKLFIKATVSSTNDNTYVVGGDTITINDAQLQWNKITVTPPSASSSTWICIDSKLNLIEEYIGESLTTAKKSDIIYNKDIASGEFFKIPTGDSVLKFETENATNDIYTIQYDYLYF